MDSIYWYHWNIYFLISDISKNIQIIDIQFLFNLKKKYIKNIKTVSYRYLDEYLVKFQNFIYQNDLKSFNIHPLYVILNRCKPLYWVQKLRPSNDDRENQCESYVGYQRWGLTNFITNCQYISSIFRMTMSFRRIRKYT